MRDRWPGTPEAAVALARTSVLYRLHVRGRSGAAYVADTEFKGPARLENVDSLVTAADGSIYFSNGAGVGTIRSTPTARPPSAVRPRGLTLDSMGQLVVVEVGQLRPQTGNVISLAAPRAGGAPQALEKMDGVVAMAGGDWVVSDEDERGLLRFDRAGKSKGLFAQGRMLRLAVNAFNETAGIDRDTKAIVVLDAAGKVLTRVPAKGQGYLLENPVDVRFDEFGHLYVLDRDALLVFDLSQATGAAGTPPKLVTRFSEPERSPTAFSRATAFTIDASGRLYIADERAQRVLAFR